MTPIAHARSVFSRLAAEGVTGVLCSFSGGKDSLAVLDLCCCAFRPSDVVAVHYYLVPDLDYLRPRLDIARSRYGIRLIQLPHPNLAQFVRTGYFRKADSTAKTRIRSLKRRDVEAVARLRTGIDWIVSGERKTDSLFRRGMLNQTDDGIWWKHRKAFPIIEWKPRDVFAYLRSRKLPIPFDEEIDTLAGTNGDMLSPDFLLWLRSRHPADYRKFQAVFPYVDSILAKEQIHARHAIQTEAAPVE